MINLAPIILFTYNRPWHTQQTLEALKRNDLASESILYIYCDGAKKDATKEDIEKISEVRRVVRNFSCCKEIHIIEAENNKGLANSIIEGVTDIINQYGKVIVLEDDLVTSPYFLKYMNEALSFYQSYPAVFSVSANRPPQNLMYIPQDYEYDVFVSLRSYSTGWATWKDRWDMVDWSLDKFEELLKHPNQVNALNRAGEDVSKMLMMQKNGEIDSWALRFGLAHFIHHAVAILPCVSYVDNIGFDGTGTHSGTVQQVYRNDLSLACKEPRFLDVIYEDASIINAFYSRFYPSKRPLWKKGINFLYRKMGKRPPFIIKKKIYYK